ncbi:MAG TPA: Uma2 family endonuclease [Bryobacteraceae bacterium]|nr:Uma2 family endonuclease [Bryobacteraceae bacterium]
MGHRVGLTSDEYLALPDEFHPGGERIRDELIAGELVQYPFFPLTHSLVISNIVHVLLEYEIAHEDHPYRVMAHIGYQVSDYDTFVPDVSLVRREQLSIEARIIQGPPGLAIEVVAPSDLAVHLRRKIDAYLENGADRVWVVYPDGRSVEVHSRDAILDLRGDDKLEEPLLPGWSAPVSSFFDR